MPWENRGKAPGRDLRSKELDITTLRPLNTAGNWAATIAKAFSLSKYVYFPAGTYQVTAFDVPTDGHLLTDGRNTIFEQLSTATTFQRVVNVVGSNVVIETLTVTGNIATATDEQQHAVFVQANSSTGNIENVHIGDVYASDIRGDAVYIGHTDGYLASGVRIGTIYPDNVYRNGLTIASGSDVKCDGVYKGAVGFYAVDVEPNPGQGPARNIEIGTVVGRSFSLYGPSASDYIENVDVKVLDLSPANSAASTPAYAFTVDDGAYTRNVNNVRFGLIKARGFNRFGFRGTFTAGDLASQSVEIGSLDVATCSITDAVFNAYTIFTGLQCRIGILTAVCTGFAKRAVQNLKNSHVSVAKITVDDSAAAFLQCDDIVIGSLIQTGLGYTFQTVNRGTVLGGQIACKTIGQGSAKCTFISVTATASVIAFNSGFEDHAIIGSTINTVYTALGSAQRNYLSPLTFGSNYLWVDSTGDLRVKSSAPTSDTDGTVVGTQT